MSDETFNDALQTLAEATGTIVPEVPEEVLERFVSGVEASLYYRLILALDKSRDETLVIATLIKKLSEAMQRRLAEVNAPAITHKLAEGERLS